MNSFSRFFVAVAIALSIAAFSANQNASAQALKADYQFQNTRSSSVAGAPDLTDLIAPGQTCGSYCNIFATDTVSGSSGQVLQFPQNNGLALSPTTSVLTNNGIYSIVVQFKFSDVSGYTRILDFKNSNNDDGLYNLDGTLQFFSYSAGPDVFISADTYVQVVLTRDSAGTLNGYVNGVQEFSVDDSANQRGVIDSNNNLRFFQDNTSGSFPNEASAGSVARIRIYDGALTAGQVTALNPCTPAPPGMVSWWDAEGSGRDIRGENDGTPQGGVTFPTGEVGHAFGLNGSGQYVEVPSNPGVRITGAISVDAWINPTTTSPAQQAILSKYDSPAFQQSYILALQSGGGLRFAVYQTGDGSILRYVDTASGLVSTGTFTHVAATFDPGTQAMKIYVNGVDTNAPLGAGSTSVSAIFDGTAAVRIGAVVNSSIGQTLFSGLIDEVEVFSRALTVSEIQNIFNAGPAGKCKPRCTAPPTGMVSWWDGDDDPFDRQGTNHGTLQGGATYSSGKVGRAFSFNGTDAYVQLPSDPTLDPTGAGSLDAWVKFNQLPSVAGHDMEIVGTDDSSAGNDFDLEADTSDRFVFSVDDSERATSTTVIQTGVWYHVAGTGDSTGLRIYVNGVLEDTNPSQFSRGTSSQPMQIGHQSGSENTFFNGLIDEVEVFNRALTATEVQAINNSASAGKCKQCLAPPNNMIGWWAGDGDARDVSGGGNDGTLEGGTSFAIGKVGQSFSFNGTDAAVVAAPASVTVMNQLPLTIDAWVRPSLRTDGTIAGGQFFPNNAVSNDLTGFFGHGFGVNVMSDGSEMTIEYQDGFRGIPGVSFNADQWYHIATVYTVGNVKSYVDGLLVDDFSYTQDPLDSTAPVSIGKHNDDDLTYGTRRFFKGLIDEVEVFNRALDISEIQSIIAAGTSGKCKQAGQVMAAKPNRADFVLTHQVGDATITFNSATSEGVTTYQTLDSYQAGPMPFSYNSPAEIADISTATTFSGTARVCFNLQAPEFDVPFSQLRILHLEGNDLVNRTSFAQSSTRTLCADVSSLSPFVITQNPTAPTATNGSIGGTVTDASGVPVSGVTINLSGTQAREAITDSSGKYSFDSVETNGFYTVTPGRADYSFSPANRSFSLLGAQTEASFVATANGDRANAIDTIEFFVRQHYLDFLNREPDPPGFIGWVNTLRNCAAGDASCDRVHVSESFYRAQEFQERGYFAYRFYTTALGRKPDYAEFSPDLARVSGFLTNDQLEAAKTAFIDDFMTRPAFARQYDSLSDAAFVDKLMQTAGVNLSNRQALIDALRTRRLRRAEVLRQIAESGEVYRRYYNQAFVVMEYFGYLHRDPDALYLDWVRALDANPADSRRMVDGFVNSTEYRQRFGP